jgi:hypothetical protein
MNRRKQTALLSVSLPVKTIPWRYKRARIDSPSRASGLVSNLDNAIPRQGRVGQQPRHLRRNIVRLAYLGVIAPEV